MKPINNNLEYTESDYDSYNHQGKRRDQLAYSESILTYIVKIFLIGLIIGLAVFNF